MNLAELYFTLEEIEKQLGEKTDLALKLHKVEDALHLLQENNLSAIETITISHIDWAAPKETKKSLPKKVNIPVTIDNAYLLEDINGYADELCDYLSDTYGYCVNGFSVALDGIVQVNTQSL